VETDAFLNILHDTEREEDMDDICPNLSSWCPNFNRSQKTSMLGLVSIGFHAGFREQLGQDTEIPLYAGVLDENVVLVQGFHVETIKHIEDSAWRWWDNAPELEGKSSAGQSISWIAVCFETTRQIYSSQDEAIDAHSRTLIANTLKSKRCTSDVKGVYQLMKAVLAVKAPENWPLTSEESELMSAITDPQWADVTDYMFTIHRTCENRVLFSTAGSKVGLGPSRMRSGDLVYIIRNTLTPFVLRPVEGRPGHFQLIGDAYVHGLMYGEAFESFGKNEFKNLYLN